VLAYLGGMATDTAASASDTAATSPRSDGPDIHTTAGKIADLELRREAALHAGSERAVEQQHAKGKLTARERIDYLLDPGSFV
jgi:propionyl-CoA carboxylase beta chain